MDIIKSRQTFRRKLITRVFYILKPLIPRRVQIFARSIVARRKLPKVLSIWPIDEKAGAKPDSRTRWPNKKQFALVLTHDVDTLRGHDRCKDLMRLEMKAGFRSSFNFVPERYPVSPELRQLLIVNGFEIGVHGLKHDGQLYNSFESFSERALHINRYLNEWKSVGFRSPSMHHNLDWIHLLDIEYDASTFDVDPFEPLSDGVRTIFPFFVRSNDEHNSSYIELPYTLPQDFTLFILLREQTIDIWKCKLDWIAEQGGMALINVHPDYMGFGQNNLDREEYSSSHYRDFLTYVQTKYNNQYWHVLPKEMSRFWNSLAANDSTDRK